MSAEAGTLLARWRRHYCLTQADLAAKLGVTGNTVSNWERGATSIPTHLWLALETVKRDLRGDYGTD